MPIRRFALNGASSRVELNIIRFSIILGVCMCVTLAKVFTVLDCQSWVKHSVHELRGAVELLNIY